MRRTGDAPPQSAHGSAARRRAMNRLARKHRREFRALLREENARWQPYAAPDRTT